MDPTDNDRHRMNQPPNRPENAYTRPHEYAPHHISSEIPRTYHNRHTHDRVHFPQYPYYGTQRHNSHAPSTFPPEHQQNQDRLYFSVDPHRNQYLPYRYQHYRYDPYTEPPGRYIQYDTQQRPLQVRTVLISNDHFAIPPTRPISSSGQYNSHYRLLPPYYTNQIRPEQRSFEPYPSHVIPERQAPVYGHYHEEMELPQDYVKYVAKQVDPRHMAGIAEVVSSVPQESNPSDKRWEEPEEKDAAMVSSSSGLSQTRPEILEQLQTKTAVVSKNPYLTLSREEWQEKLQRPSSPMSQEQRDIWHQNVFYAVDAYVFPFPGPPFKCPICDKEERRRSELINHIRSHMPGPNRKPFLCRLCGKGFRRPCLLEDHMDRHVKFAYVCNVCGRGYHRQSLLQEHQECSHMKHLVSRKGKNEQVNE